MKKILLLILLFYSFIQIYSQSDFRKGFIVTKTGDTIMGYVDFKESVQRFSVCHFKTNENGEAKVYKPPTINAYGFLNDRQYISREIKDESTDLELVFLEVLVRGKVTLYKYRNRYYVDKDNSQFIGLTYPERNVKIGGKYFKKKSPKPVGILRYLLADCKKIKSKINKISLIEKQLTLLIEEYNNCVNEYSVSYKEKKPWIKTSFGISVGLNASTLKFNDEFTNSRFFTNELGNANTMTFGASLDILSPRLNERVSFHSGLFYSRINYLTNQEEGTSIKDAVTDLDLLRVPLGFKYTFPERTNTLYLSMGLSANIFLENASIWTTERQLQNNTIVTTEDKIDISTNGIGYWAGIGLKRNITSKVMAFIELRFDYSVGKAANNQSQSYSYTMPNAQFSIGLSL
ncbi:MAG: hypothetical protein QNJ57_06135 [Flavobacteriaceae bacterium]|nr:hypothetical protein [Flavobacteriaceae bacterium]